MSDYILKIISKDQMDNILPLISGLNPNVDINILVERQIEMFKMENYRCFGIMNEEKLVGICSGWISVRLYSGKQLEIDNVIIDPSFQSVGIGSKFMLLLESWAKDNDCKTIELNTYVQNSRSHKFYFNKGFKILGFHFQKHIK